MPLPVILVVRVDIVSRLDARTFVGRPRLDGEEVDKSAVRRPGRRRHAGGVAGDHACLATAGGHDGDLSVADNEDLFAVGGPSRRRLAAGSRRQLHRCAAGDVLAPDVAGAPVRCPVDLIELVQHGPAVGRQLRIEDARHLAQVNQRHRPRRLGSPRRPGSDDEPCDGRSERALLSPAPGPWPPAGCHIWSLTRYYLTRGASGGSGR
jgi:hypothetical protein